jgi:serine/threonine protein kinase
MSPQAANGERPTPATDVYVLGAGLFHILTGEVPHRAKDTLETLLRIIEEPTPRARSVNPSVPRALDAVCAKAMAYEVAGRYATADDLADDVERWLAGRAVSAYRPPLLLRPAHAAGRLIARLRGRAGTFT